MEKFDVIIKRGLRDFNPRQLIINEEFIKFENKDIRGNTFTTFNKNEIKGYKFGIKWIQLDVTLGREYVIEINKVDGEILKINFKTYFGYKVQKRHELYGQILDALWGFHFGGIVDGYLQQHSDGEEFQVGNVFFSNIGITIKVDGLFKTEDAFIIWENVRTRSYQTYFSIFSEENPEKLNRGYSYLDDWNTVPLYSVLRTILRDKNIETYESTTA